MLRLPALAKSRCQGVSFRYRNALDFLGYHYYHLQLESHPGPKHLNDERTCPNQQGGEVYNRKLEGMASKSVLAGDIPIQ